MPVQSHACFKIRLMHHTKFRDFQNLVVQVNEGVFAKKTCFVNIHSYPHGHNISLSFFLTTSTQSRMKFQQFTVSVFKIYRGIRLYVCERTWLALPHSEQIRNFFTGCSISRNDDAGSSMQVVQGKGIATASRYIKRLEIYQAFLW